MSALTAKPNVTLELSDFSKLAVVHRVATDQKTSQNLMNCNISKCCAIIRTFTEIFPNNWLQSLIYIILHRTTEEFCT